MNAIEGLFITRFLLGEMVLTLAPVRFPQLPVIRDQLRETDQCDLVVGLLSDIVKYPPSTQ